MRLRNGIPLRMCQLLTPSHVRIYTIRLQYISLSPRRGTVLKKWSRWNRQGKRLDSTDKKGKSTRSPSIIADRIDVRGSRSEAIKPSYKVRSESLAPLAVPWRRLSPPSTTATGMERDTVRLRAENVCIRVHGCVARWTPRTQGVRVAVFPIGHWVRAWDHSSS